MYAKSSTNNLILAGDYNINMLKINEKEHCSRFFDLLTSFSLFPQITLSTRFTTCNGTLIDNFCCNIQNKKTMLKVKDYLISIKIYEKLDISPIADTNRNYNIILDEINQAKNKYMKSKLMKFNKYKHKKSTWITQGLLASIRHRDILYKQIKLTNPDSPEHEMLLINLRTYNVILKRSFIF